MNWESTRRPVSEEVHVWPYNDLVMHEWENCACIPFVESCPRPDGSFGWLVTHNAWDHRE